MGTLRFVLSALVVNGHLNTIWWPATFAVFSFYMISGYLMTLIMNRRYGYSQKGILSYLFNRVLRIYPTYYVALALSLFVILFIPSDLTQNFNAAIRLPTSFLEFIKNTFIFGLNIKDAARLVPPAWALYNEIFYYVAIGLLLGKSRKITIVWLVLSILYVPSLCFLRNDLCSMFHHRYFTILAASLPFSIGSCLFHSSPFIFRFFKGLSPRKLLLASTLLYTSNYLFAFLLPLDSLFYFYTNLLTTALLLVSIFHYLKCRGKRNTFLSKLDLQLGKLSYPIYLFHWQSAVIMSSLLGFENKSFASFYFGFLFSIVLGLLEITLFSSRIDMIRERIKNALPSSA